MKIFGRRFTRNGGAAFCCGEDGCVRPLAAAWRRTSECLARRLAGANMVIVNGLGYDNWADQLLSARREQLQEDDSLIVQSGDVGGAVIGEGRHQERPARSFLISATRSPRLTLSWA